MTEIEASQRKVSIVIPTYNMAHYLPAALESAIAEPYTDREIIVLDDGSTDDTAQVIRPFLPLIRYVRQENRGLAAALNNALTLARGEYLRFLDADDCLCPGTLQVQVDILDRNPRVALVHGQAYLTDGKGRIYGLRQLRGAKGSTIMTSAAAFRWLLKGCEICKSTVMVRRSALKRAGAFQTASLPGEDWDMWMRLATQHDLAYVATPLAYYRTHSQSITAKYTLAEVAASHEHSLRTLFSRRDLPYRHLQRTALASLDRTIARVAARMRNRGAFARHFARGIGQRPAMGSEAETWATLFEGVKMLVPPALLAGGRKAKHVLAPVLLALRRRERPRELIAANVSANSTHIAVTEVTAGNRDHDHR